jgi:CheY-like chemotaxis protein
VDVLPDGADAIMAVQAIVYDIVLMDVQMSGMDGITATKRIRALPGRENGVPIVAMTANVLPQQVQSFRSAGMDGHVAKPLRRDALFATIERCIAEASGATVDASPADARPSCSVVDEEVFSEAISVLGNTKGYELLGRLGTELKDRFPRNPDSIEEHEQLARDAHKLISTAGLFGLAALSQSCSRLEAAIHKNEDVGPPLEIARAACREAMAEIAARVASANRRAARDMPTASTRLAG